MSMANKDLTVYAETELTAIVKRFLNSVEESKANAIAKEIAGRIDWNDPALMHKGLSWMAKDYLVKKNMM